MSNRIKVRENFSIREILSAIDSKITNYDELNNTTELLQIFRTVINKPITIIDISKLNHAKYGYHPKSRAVDIFIHDITTNDVDYIVETALNAGFKGVGVYINQDNILSFHFDTRNQFAFWRGTKSKRYSSWTYTNLIEA